jgi:acyl-CoA synthetase (NDP forming)
MEALLMATHPLEEILHPRGVAVVGASARGGRGPSFLSALCNLGFEGGIYPVNPKYDEINGLRAYASVRDIPGVVDFVISSVPAPQVLGMVADCAEKGVKAIHLFTARFSETGRKDAADLEQEILRKAQEAGIRLIGPNCMGVYYPAGRLSFTSELPRESGSVGVISQSGSAVHDIVDAAAVNGLRFSKGFSYGNALDFNECDYLEYLEQDPDTKMVLMYIEGVREGKRFFDTLRRTTATKPVIILKGGRGKSGTRATASHTASLAGSHEVWEAAVRQAGGISVRHPEELADVATALHYLPPVTGRAVGVAGGAGGSTVMAADLCEEAGLDVIPLPDEIREEMKAQGSPIWDWIGNPADMSIRIDRDWGTGDMLRTMAGNPSFDLLITFVHGHFHGGGKVSAEKFLEDYRLAELDKPLLAVIEQERRRGNDDQAWVEKLMEKVKARLRGANVPVYASIERAAGAASKLIDYYQRREAS